MAANTIEYVNGPVLVKMIEDDHCYGFDDVYERYKQEYGLEDVAPVIHAHWIKNYFPGSVECGCPILVDATCSHCAFKMYESYLYCPQCGSKMDNGMVLDCET